MVDYGLIANKKGSKSEPGAKVYKKWKKDLLQKEVDTLSETRMCKKYICVLRKCLKYMCIKIYWMYEY